MMININLLRNGLLLFIAAAVLLPMSNVNAQVITVQPGDTLFKIAQGTNTNVSQIKQLNGLTNDTILVGQALTVPDTITHTVVRGDTIWKLSQAYRVSANDIMTINKLKDTQIIVGQSLIIPKSSDSTSPVQNSTNRISFKDYKIQNGDNAWSISLNHGIPMSELLKVNNLTENSTLKPGLVIKIPVHTIAVTSTPGPQYGEYLDWFQSAQYLFPINKVATVTDLLTGAQFKVKRVIGAFHSDTEPLTSEDAAKIKVIWGGNYSWKTRAVVVTVDSRRIAASMTSMPHGNDYITDNNYVGQFDIHFKNSLRHVDGKMDMLHQTSIKKAAGLQ